MESPHFRLRYPSMSRVVAILVLCLPPGCASAHSVLSALLHQGFFRHIDQDRGEHARRSYA